jgi:arylsulfatase A-like enzyme
MDLFPTLLRAAGAMQAETTKLDGMDLTPLLKDHTAKLVRDALYFHYPHYYETTTPVSAIRAGDWKLLEYFEDKHFELYNLKNDLSESVDLALKLPEKAAELLDRLHRHLESIGAEMPTPNPEYKAKQGEKKSR